MKHCPPTPCICLSHDVIISADSSHQFTFVYLMMSSMTSPIADFWLVHICLPDDVVDDVNDCYLLIGTHLFTLWCPRWCHRLLTSDWLTSCLQPWHHLFTVMMSPSLHCCLTYDVPHWEKHELPWQCNIITNTNTGRNMSCHGSAIS